MKIKIKFMLSIFMLTDRYRKFVANGILLLLLLFNACITYNQNIKTSSHQVLMDEEFIIRAENLKPGQAAIIRAMMFDNNENLWQSYAGFYADKKGMIDLSIHAPENGVYSDVNPMGLIQFMNLPFNHPKYGSRFIIDHDQSSIVKFILEIDGKTVDSVKVTRSYLKAGVVSRDIKKNGVFGKLFIPSDQGKYPAIIVLTGSEGGWTSIPRAKLLANHGFATLALPYFAIEGLPETLAEIPVEYFQKAIDLLQHEDQIISDQIGIIGTSKGGEAALLVASLDTRIKSVVALVSPTAVWYGLVYGFGKSSWTFKGKSLPYVPYASDPTYNPAPNFARYFAAEYRYQIYHTDSFEKYLIKVENINGPILFVTAKKDLMFPSFESSEISMNRLRKNKHPFTYEHISYEYAGHSIGNEYTPIAGSFHIAGGRFLMGGTPEGKAFAIRDSWPKIINFFKSSLK